VLKEGGLRVDWRADAGKTHDLGEADPMTRCPFSNLACWRAMDGSVTIQFTAASLRGRRCVVVTEQVLILTRAIKAATGSGERLIEAPRAGSGVLSGRNPFPRKAGVNCVQALLRGICPMGVNATSLLAESGWKVWRRWKCEEFRNRCLAERS